MHDEKLPQGEIRVNTPFLKKAENFFYHYKWHTIIGLFLVVVLLICCLQMCAKEPYDIEVMYAGPADVTSQRRYDIENAFASVTPDNDENGEGQARLTHYWINEKYYGGANADEAIKDANVGQLANQSLTNQEKYIDEIMLGNVSICLVSPHLFDLANKEGAFVRIDELLPSLSAEMYHAEEDGTYNPYGVTLAKTDFGKLAGLSSLPEDTVFCLRKPAYNLMNAKRAEEEHEKAKAVFLAALQFVLEE